MKQMSLTCVRHGEATHNVKVGYCIRYTEDGSAVDTSLTVKGEDQAKKVSKRLATESFDLAASSDLERAYNTALAILELHPDVEQLEEWKSVREPKGGGHDPDKWTKIREQMKLFMPRLIKVAMDADQTHLNILIVSHSCFLYELHRQLGLNYPHSNQENFSESDYKKCMNNTAVSKFEIKINEDTESIEDVHCTLWGCDAHLREPRPRT